MSQNEFFISHATADRELVSEFVDFMEVALKVDRSKIYCTSGIGTKTIRTGTNFIEDIKKNVIGTKVVIFILTPNYFKSNFCLAELGAAWALNSDIYPILIPPTPIEVLKSTPLSESSQVITLNTLEDIVGIADEFVDMKVAKYGGAKLLNTRANRLLDWIKENCSFEIDDTVSKAEFLNLQSDLLVLKRTIEMKKIEIVELTSHYETRLEIEREGRVKVSKDAHEKEHTREYAKKEATHRWELFDEHVKNAKNALYRLDNIVISAIFYDEFLRGEAKFWPMQNKDIDWDVFNQLRADRMIFVYKDDNQIAPNHGELLVEEAINQLYALQRFISFDVDQRMKGEFAEEYEFNLDFKSKRFWEKILGVKIYV